MAKARKRPAGRLKKTKAKRSKKRVKARNKTAKSKAKRKTASRKKKAVRRKRTTAEGMRRALRMKQAADDRKEEMQAPATRTSPVPAPAFIEPDPVSHNIREQGDVANIIQNTSSRRGG
jgi:hypothetical protein